MNPVVNWGDASGYRTKFLKAALKGYMPEKFLIVAESFPDADRYAEKLGILSWQFIIWHTQLHPYVDKEVFVIILGKKAKFRDDYKLILQFLENNKIKYKVYPQL